MAMGVPVAAAPVGGVAELLKRGHSGLILPADDREWPEAMAPLLNEPAIRAKCIRRGRRRFEKHFSLRRRARRELSVYSRLLTPRSGTLAPAAA
jgi:glycosyltransferase involved in cell wall biosynthesis